jgi:hypothetical protein
VPDDLAGRARRAPAILVTTVAAAAVRPAGDGSSERRPRGLIVDDHTVVHRHDRSKAS